MYNTKYFSLLIIWILLMAMPASFAQDSINTTSSNDDAIIVATPTNIAPDSTTSTITTPSDVITSSTTSNTTPLITPPSSTTTLSDSSSTNLGVNIDASAVCSTSSLTPQEAQKILNLTKDGFTIRQEQSDDARIEAKNKDKPLAEVGGVPISGEKELGPDSVYVESPDGETAQRQALPTEPFSPELLSNRLGENYQGPFGVGLVLDDTLRVGRCVGLNDDECYLTGLQQTYRNSGKGVLSDMKSIAVEFKDLASKVTGYSQEELETLEAYNYAANPEDYNKIEIQLKQRVSDEVVTNSIKSNNFSAKTQTNCQDGSCYINIYSTFDKHFNAGFSTEMVVGTFGPSLLNGARKYFGSTISYVGDKTIVGKALNKGNDLVKAVDNKLSTILPNIANINYIKRFSATVKKYDLEKHFDDLWAGKKKLFAGGGFAGFWTGKMGVIRDIKDPTVRKAVFSLSEDLTRFTSNMKTVQESLNEAYKLALKQAGNNVDEIARIKIEFASRNFKEVWKPYGDFMGFDFPEYFIDNKDVFSGLSNYAVKVAGQTDNYYQLVDDSTFIDNILSELSDAKSFDNFTKYQLGKNAEGVTGITLYNPVKGAKYGTATPDQLLANLPKDRTLMVQLDSGQAYKLTDATAINKLKEQYGNGPMQVFYVDGYKKVMELTPLELSERMLAEHFTGRAKTAARNAETIRSTLLSYGFGNQKAGNLLSAELLKNEEILKAYLHPKTGLLITGETYLYGFAKSGFGAESISALRLPDSWKSVNAELDEGTLYHDAYVDFFVNEGSDQGDVFNRVINNLFWPKIVGALANNVKPISDIYYSFTSSQPSVNVDSTKWRRRDEVDDVAFYTTTTENCTNCGFSIAGKDEFKSSFNTSELMTGYLMEMTEKENREIGSTLIMYSHHTDLTGSDKVSLAEAIRNKETCNDKIRDLPIPSLVNSPALYALGHAVGESFAYAFFGVSIGISSSILQQAFLLKGLTGCVDTEEGYYIHLFVPNNGDDKKNETFKVSTENLTQILDSFSYEIGKTVTQNSQINNGLDQLKTNMEEFSTSLKKSDVLQATIQFEGTPSSGSLIGTKLFHFWYKGHGFLSEYKDTGKEYLTDMTNKREIEIDLENGTIKEGDEVLVNNTDIARLSSAPIDTRIPAKLVPQNISYAGLSGSTEVAIEIKSNGAVNIIDTTLLDCIKTAVFSQTGVKLTSNDLTTAFGEIKNLTTTTHQKIIIDKTNLEIIAESSAYSRTIAKGTTAKAQIHGNRTTILTDLTKVDDIGLFNSIQFQHGMLLVKPETNEIIVWLRQHKDSVLSNNEVTGLKGKLKQTTNPLTECPEPAIQLEAIAKSGDDLAQYKTEKFNASMEHLGPFKIFKTPTKTYMFYSLLEDGVCNDYFRIIDNETGEILLDEPITNITETEDGVLIETPNGTHTLDFSTDTNGAPRISFDGGQPEILRSAQGEKGSFWYDPDTGLWYPENSQMIGANEGYKNYGSLDTSNNGNVTGGPGSNPINLNIGSQGGSTPFNIPSLPENHFFLLIFVITLLGVMIIAQESMQKRKYKN